MELINKNIRFLRVKAGWTQRELAERLGMKQPLIGAYEEFRSQPPIRTLVKMSDLFQVNLDTLIREDLEKTFNNKKPTILNRNVSQGPFKNPGSVET